MAVAKANSKQTVPEAGIQFPSMPDQPSPGVLCPHLGLADDSETSFRFTTDENRCWRVNPPAEISQGHQTKYCFGANYGQCPIYQTGRPSAGVKIRRGRAPGGPSQPISWRVVVVVVEVMLVLLVGGILYYFPRAVLLSTPFADSPRPTPSPLLTRPVAAVLPTTGPTVVLTPSLPLTSTNSPTSTPPGTPTFTPAPGLDQPIGPFNLVAHRVESGENLIGISARFNTTREVLVKVNGLSDQRPILVGQILVVPQGLADSSQVPKMVAFQAVQDTFLDVIVNQLFGDMAAVRQLNALGDSNIVPAGRWLFIPQP